jgi:hypothetical protein
MVHFGWGEDCELDGWRFRFKGFALHAWKCYV